MFKRYVQKIHIKVSFKDFPLVGIWTPYYKETNTTAPFLCIEPWYGIADNIDSDKIYQNKKYINKLNVGETFVASYDIEIIQIIWVNLLYTRHIK